MAESTLQDRLRSHAQAFDGLLSLIPAKHYYGQDNSDQYKRKKQTKEEAKAARLAKLNPDSAKSAKDVMDESAKKRKLQDLEDSDAEADVELEGIEKEQPRQGLKTAEPKTKKQKKEPAVQPAEQAEEDEDVSGAPKQDNVDTEKAERQRVKEERKKAKQAKKAEKKADKKKNKEEASAEEQPSPADESKTATAESKDDAEDAEPNAEWESVADDADDTVEHMDVDGLVEKDDEQSDAPNSPDSPVFDDNFHPSTNTSTSSVVPPTKAPKHITIPANPDAMRARLAARIEELRAARKADGPDGRPAVNRQELMEARRRKEERRRAAIKEQRAKAKAEEDARREEALASARDSPCSSLFSPSIQSPDTNFSFGRIAFADGQQLAGNLTSLMSAPKRKGPQDPATALQATEKKRQRLAGLDEEKRADIEEKELWLNAKKRAQGEKIRDDTSLLKKTLKRKEQAKKKSEKEWNERIDGVQKSQAARQKKREENLKKRRDEKGGKGKKGKSGVKSKPKSRPGFEGSFSSNGGKRR